MLKPGPNPSPDYNSNPNPYNRLTLPCRGATVYRLCISFVRRRRSSGDSVLLPGSTTTRRRPFFDIRVNSNWRPRLTQRRQKLQVTYIIT